MRNREDAVIARVAARLSSVMSEFREVNPNIPTQIVHFFLAAAARPGRSVMEIGRSINMSKSSAQRAYQALSADHWRATADGMDMLFATENPDDPRLHAIYLTDKGRQVLARASRAVAPLERR